MYCPNCKTELIVVERDKIELDYCPNCKGFWFDNGEWELFCARLALVSKSSLTDLNTIPPINTNDMSKSCPYCSVKMDKILAYGTILDRCPRGHGIWFDAGECSRVFSSASSSRVGTPIEFLGEVFY